MQADGSACQGRDGCPDGFSGTGHMDFLGAQCDTSELTVSKCDGHGTQKQLKSK